jgi:hypothetical protein
MQQMNKTEFILAFKWCCFSDSGKFVGYADLKCRLFRRLKDGWILMKVICSNHKEYPAGTKLALWPAELRANMWRFYKDGFGRWHWNYRWDETAKSVDLPKEPLDEAEKKLLGLCVNLWRKGIPNPYLIAHLNDPRPIGYMRASARRHEDITQPAPSSTLKPAIHPALLRLVDSLNGSNLNLSQHLAASIGLDSSKPLRWLPLCNTSRLRQYRETDVTCQRFAVARCSNCGDLVCKDCLQCTKCSCLPF